MFGGDFFNIRVRVLSIPAVFILVKSKSGKELLVNVSNVANVWNSDGLAEIEMVSDPTAFFKTEKKYSELMREFEDIGLVIG